MQDVKPPPELVSVGKWTDLKLVDVNLVISSVSSSHKCCIIMRRTNTCNFSNRTKYELCHAGGPEPPEDPSVAGGSLTRLTRLVHAQLDWRLQVC